VTRVVAHTLNRAETAQLYIVRGMLVLVICAALVLPVDVVGVLTGPGGLRPTHILLLTAAAGAGLTAVAAAVRPALRAGACLRFLGVRREPGTTIIEDLHGAATRLCAAGQRHVPAAARSGPARCRVPHHSALAGPVAGGLARRPPPPVAFGP